MDSRYTVVAVVGHIDHGKTSLVKALTGVDTDTHPEEKRRGITIDLGFAVWRDQGDEYALIDAPGHQKYIGNLVSGVSRVDLGLLVVAADQGIQAQTLEHVAVLRAIGVQRIAVVISRTDLSPATVIEPLTEDLQLFLSEFDWFDFPILTFSAIDHRGLEDVRSCLRSHALAERETDGWPFRMPIDRTLSIRGRGCVVAGSIWHGRIRVGDSLRIAGGELVRVRELETHGRLIGTAGPGRRVAVNLVGVSAGDLHRGDELIAPDSYQLSQRLLVQVHAFDSAPKIDCPAIVQLHTGTLGCEARIVGVPALERGKPTHCVIETQQGVIANHGQHFLLRRPYPVGCFAGGRVLTSLPDRTGTLRTQLELAERLSSPHARERMLGWLDFNGYLDSSQVASLSWQIGVAGDRWDELLSELLDKGDCIKLDGDLIVSRVYGEDVQKRLLKHLAKSADQAQPWHAEASLLHFGGRTSSPAVMQWCLDQLHQRGKIAKVNAMVAIASDQTQLSKLQRNRLTQLIALLKDQRTPPSLTEMGKTLSIPSHSLTSLMRFAQQQDLVVDIGGGWVFGRDELVQLIREVDELFKQNESLSVAQIRDHWNMTRKHAIPLLEFFDRVEITIRQQGERIAGPELSGWLSNTPEAKDALP